MGHMGVEGAKGAKGGCCQLPNACSRSVLVSQCAALFL